MAIPSKETQALIKFLELGLEEAKQGKFLTVEQFRDRMILKYGSSKNTKAGDASNHWK